MTDEKLQGLMKEWVDRLGLQSWTIKLNTNQRPENMSDKNALGCVDYVECNRTARIEIIAPEYVQERVGGFDEEKTLVHELLHLKMSLFFEGDVMLDRVAHIILNDMAKALVDAKRDGIRKQPERSCGTCQYMVRGGDQEPCISCKWQSNWTPKGEDHG